MKNEISQTCGLLLHGPRRREQSGGHSCPPDLSQSLVHVEASPAPRPAAERVNAHVHVVPFEEEGKENDAVHMY